MPRPKRAKIVPSAPTAIPTKSSPSKEARENAPHHPSSRTGTTNSDDSEGLITRNKTGTNNKGVPKKQQYMSGALGVQDALEKHARPPRGRERAALSRVAREADHARAIEALQKRRDEALARAAAEKVQEHEPPKAAMEQEVVPSSMPEADQAITQAKTRDETVQQNAKQIRRPEPISRAPATPLAETSILALANFKRRLRKPSLLQISQPKDDVANDDEEDDMDDFEPDDESTPFRLSTSRSQVAQTPTAQESLLPQSSQRQSTGSRKRKLTPPQLQVQRSQGAVSPPHPELPRETTSRPASPSIHESASAPQSPAAPSTPEPALPALPRQTRKSQPLQPTQPQSDTFAPPRSSSAPPIHAPSPSAPSPLTPPSHKPSRARKPKKNPGPSPLKVISTASLQNLLPRRKKQRRHRGREKDFYDILSSGDLQDASSDVDELSYHAPPAKAKLNPRIGRVEDENATVVVKKKKKKEGKGSTAATAPKPKAKTKVTKPAPAKSKAKASAAKASAPGPAPATRTYGQASKAAPAAQDSASSSPLSEPESVSSPAEGTSPPTDPSRDGKAGRRDEAGPKVAQHKDFKSLVQKFKEVDAWELSFEEVTASSSSPADAR